jgi:hypothetical protein
MKTIIIGIAIGLLLATGFAAVYAVSSPSTQRDAQVRVAVVKPQGATVDGGTYETGLCPGGEFQTIAPLPVNSNMAGMLRHLGYDYR